MRIACVTPVLLMGAIACASAPAQDQDNSTTETVKRTIGSHETIDLTRTSVIRSDDFRSPPGRVWGAVLSAGEQLGLTVQTRDSINGMAVFHLPASTGRIAGRPASYWVDCGLAPGGVPRASTYQITLNVTALVQSGEDNGTRVRTSMVAYARERGMSGAGLPCTSTGKLEEQLLVVAGTKLAS
jgi:hypothetical protein